MKKKARGRPRQGRQPKERLSFRVEPAIKNKILARFGGIQPFIEKAIGYYFPEPVAVDED